MNRHWIGVDLDGTLARYDGFKGASHIGEPVPRMVAWVKERLDEGFDVRVFTARANPNYYKEQHVPFMEALDEWIMNAFGCPLRVTYQKDQFMVALVDDLALQVMRNVGVFCHDPIQVMVHAASKCKVSTSGWGAPVVLPEEQYTFAPIQAAKEEPVKKTVPELLEEMAATYRERNKVYGDNYKNIGRVLAGLFPGEVTIETEDDWNRLALIIIMAGKLGRYTANPQGHKDSAHDLAVYAAMLEELTQ